MSGEVALDPAAVRAATELDRCGYIEPMHERWSIERAARIIAAETMCGETREVLKDLLRTQGFRPDRFTPNDSPVGKAITRAWKVLDYHSKTEANR